VGNGFEPKVMIPLKSFHCFLLGFEKRSDYQFSVFDLLALGLPPVFPIQFTVKIIGIDQRAGFKELGLELGLFGRKMSR
jgi:hypothetical protein